MTAIGMETDALRGKSEARSNLPRGWCEVERGNPVRLRTVKMTLRR